MKSYAGIVDGVPSFPVRSAASGATRYYLPVTENSVLNVTAHPLWGVDILSLPAVRLDVTDMYRVVICRTICLCALLISILLCIVLL